MNNRATVRIDKDDVPKLSESLFEQLMLNVNIIFTEDGKDAAVTVPYDEYMEMQNFINRPENKKV